MNAFIPKPFTNFGNNDSGSVELIMLAFQFWNPLINLYTLTVRHCVRLRLSILHKTALKPHFVFYLISLLIVK